MSKTIRKDPGDSTIHIRATRTWTKSPRQKGPCTEKHLNCNKQLQSILHTRRLHTFTHHSGTWPTKVSDEQCGCPWWNTSCTTWTRSKSSKWSRQNEEAMNNATAGELPRQPLEKTSPNHNPRYPLITRKTKTTALRTTTMVLQQQKHRLLHLLFWLFLCISWCRVSAMKTWGGLRFVSWHLHLPIMAPGVVRRSTRHGNEAFGIYSLCRIYTAKTESGHL